MVWRSDNLRRRVWICTYSFSGMGIAILLLTCPVSVLAAFTMPSAPAEYSVWPSIEKASARQLILCRFVRHCVSIVPQPGFDEFDSSLLSSVSLGGNLKHWTWPEARPTASTRSVGWMACANSSEESGSVHIVSNMLRRNKTDSRVEIVAIRDADCQLQSSKIQMNHVAQPCQEIGSSFQPCFVVSSSCSVISAF